MSERITLELPDALAQAVREEAERTGQSVETVVLVRLQHTFNQLQLEKFLVPGANYEVNFPVTDETSAADMLLFLKSLKKGESQA